MYGCSKAMAVVPEMFQDIRAQSKEALEKFASESANAVRAKPVLFDGDPGTVIAEYAKKTACDLIVMPTLGYGPFRRFLLGSVTAKVLHDAPCPVWTGPHLESKRGAHQFLDRVCHGPPRCRPRSGQQRSSNRPTHLRVNTGQDWQ
jgi:hypothetical protein